jgi:hypothetical protein
VKRDRWRKVIALRQIKKPKTARLEVECIIESVEKKDQSHRFRVEEGWPLLPESRLRKSPALRWRHCIRLGSTRHSNRVAYARTCRIPMRPILRSWALNRKPEKRIVAAAKQADLQVLTGRHSR